MGRELAQINVVIYTRSPQSSSHAATSIHGNPDLLHLLRVGRETEETFFFQSRLGQMPNDLFNLRWNLSARHGSLHLGPKDAHRWKQIGILPLRNRREVPIVAADDGRDEDSLQRNHLLQLLETVHGLDFGSKFVAITQSCDEMACVVSQERTLPQDAAHDPDYQLEPLGRMSHIQLLYVLLISLQPGH